MLVFFLVLYEVVCIYDVQSSHAINRPSHDRYDTHIESRIITRIDSGLPRDVEVKGDVPGLDFGPACENLPEDSAPLLGPPIYETVHLERQM